MVKIVITEIYLLKLQDQVNYISKDKPIAALKFRKDLIKNLKKDLKYPFHYKKSIYYDDENRRDYVFKGYTSVFEVEPKKDLVTVFGFIKHIENLQL